MKSVKIKRGALTEASLADTIGDLKKVENPEVISNEGQIEMELNRALDTALDEKEVGGSDYTNVLLIGGAGTGKTSRVVAWAKAHNINLLIKNASTMDETDLGGALSPDESHKHAVRLAPTEMNALDLPRSVLFLDEYNRARHSIRGTLLTLINDHTVTDPEQPSGKRELGNFLFTIAAINPADSFHDTETLDHAERTRFKRVDVYADKKNLLQYLEKHLQQKIEKVSRETSKMKFAGQLELAKKLLGDKSFKFDDAEDAMTAEDTLGDSYIPLNPRSFTNLLAATDGTKEDLLKQWNQFCNRLKKDTVERILSSYQDIDNKANSVFKSHEDSDLDKLAKFANN